MDRAAGDRLIGEIVLLAMGLVAAALSLVARGVWSALPSHRIFLASACATLLAWACGLAEEFVSVPVAHALLDGIERALLAVSAVCFFLWALRLPDRP